MNGSPVGFMESTPRILAASVKGAIARAKTVHRLAAWTAWHTAALGRVDKLPSLESLMGPDRAAKPVQPQAWQDQLAVAALWAA